MRKIYLNECPAACCAGAPPAFHFAVIILVLILALATVASAVDNTLVVYVGAHPDDIDIGMSGSLYKYDVNKHPIIWIVVTDGGADLGEYNFESNTTRAWINRDGTNSKDWVSPAGQIFNRGFYSEDLSKKRCGIDGSYQHEFQNKSTIIQELDWKTRVDAQAGFSVVKKVQMSYYDPLNPSQTYLYPDGGIHNSKVKNLYTENIAENLAEIIYQTINSGDYDKDDIVINSHAPDLIAKNSDEHPDHEITGNAVLKAINILIVKDGIKKIDAIWYTIYNPVRPKLGYVRTQENITDYKNMKSNLVKSAWETEHIISNRQKYCWTDYPNDPGDYEYAIHVEYPQKRSSWDFCFITKIFKIIADSTPF